MHVDRRRRRGFLMLAMMVLWTMLPVSACLGSTHLMGQHACCHGMAQACDSSAMDASSSCCMVHQQSAVVAPIYPDAVDHSPSLAAVSPGVSLSTPYATSARCGRAFAPPPSIHSSAGASILRI